MKVTREQMAENRGRILDAAARLFRERGFDGVSVAEIMAAAGLTPGGFYGHFASKDALIAAALAHVLDPERAAGRGKSMADYGATYLSAGHRDDHGGGCPFSALGSEAVRATPEARQVMTEAIERQITRFSATAPGATPKARRRAAIAGWAAMVGGMILSRIADDPALAHEILKATKAELVDAG